MLEIIESDILACYAFLTHEKQTEIRMINPNNSQDFARSLFVEIKEAFLEMCKINNGTTNLYVGINERKEGGTKKEDVLSVKTIVIDIDAIRPKGEAATEEELKKAEIVADKIITWFSEKGFAQPAKNMSGNGYQLWCAIPKIIIDDITRDVIENQIKAFYKMLIAKFSGQGAQIDNIGDLPRIIKIIGTKSVKGIPSTERPHRVSHACNGFERKEDQNLKDFILALNPEPEIKETKKIEIKLDNTINVDYALKHDQKLSDLLNGRLTSNYKSRSEAEMALLCKLVWWGFSESEIQNAMQQSRIGKWNDKATADHYKEQQIKKAQGFITETRLVQKDYPEEEIEGKIKEKLEVLTEREFKLRTYLDFEKMKKDRRYLVEDFLYPQTINMLYSPPAQFKSLVAMHMAMQITNGKKFLGLKTKRMPVLLCDKENNNQLIKTRLQGMRRGEKIKSKKFPLWILSRNGDLLNQVFLNNLKDAIKEKGIKLIILDTLHRFADYEENKADDLNRIYTNVFQPIAEGYDCTILFLHHTTKEGDYRGSSDLFGMIDTAYSIKRQKGKNNFALICEKSRFGEIEKIYGTIDFEKEAIKFIRLNEEKEDELDKVKFMDLVKAIGAVFSIKGDSIKRCDLLTEFEIKKEKEEIDFSPRTFDRALSWMVKKDKLKKDKRGNYVRNWEGELQF